MPVEHLTRLRAHADVIGLEFRATNDELSLSLNQVLAANRIVDGLARITVFDEAAGPFWPSGSDAKASFLITVRAKEFSAAPLRLCFSPFPVNSRSVLAGIKSGNYLEQTIALENARSAGFDEAARLNERGEVVSAVLANIFWVKDNRLYTPALETGCLSGITRSAALTAAEKLGLSVQLTVSGRDALISADEIFITSAGQGLRPAFFDGKQPAGMPFFDSIKTSIDLS